MARVVKEHEERRNEILEAAERLFYTVGYDHASIGSLIDQLRIAKGTFYHYFPSKAELLDAVVERLSERIMQAVVPAVEQVDGAIEKIRALYRVSAAIKTRNLELLIQLSKALYAEENLVVRFKVNQKTRRRIVPLLAAIIRLGVDEGVFRTTDPEIAADAFMGLWFMNAEDIGPTLPRLRDEPELLEPMLHRMRTYELFCERILGAEEGSIGLLEAVGTETILRRLVGEDREGGNK